MNSVELARLGKPNTVKESLFYIILCLPKESEYRQVLDIAEVMCPCGTTKGWSYYEQGNPALRGNDQDVTCQENSKMKHVILIA